MQIQWQFSFRSKSQGIEPRTLIRYINKLLKWLNFRSAHCGLTRKIERNSTSGALFQTETETYLIVFYPRTLSRIIQGQFCNQRSVFKHCTGSFNKLYNSTFICLEGNINKNLLKWLNLQLLLVISREKLHVFLFPACKNTCDFNRKRKHWAGSSKISLQALHRHFYRIPRLIYLTLLGLGLIKINDVSANFN